MSENVKKTQLPELKDIEAELDRVGTRSRFRRTLGSTIGTLMVVAAIAVLVSMLWLPVLQVVGESMTPTLMEGEIMVAPKGLGFEKGDIIAFYYNNKILIKRVIANAGEWVNIDNEGNVFVNDVPLDEPYIMEKALGDCNITLPYQVPDGKIFVMGDHRATSADSRNTAVGCVAEEQIVGRVWLRLWPFKQIGLMSDIARRPWEENMALRGWSELNTEDETHEGMVRETVAPEATEPAAETGAEAAEETATDEPAQAPATDEPAEAPAATEAPQAAETAEASVPLN